MMSGSSSSNSTNNLSTLPKVLFLCRRNSCRSQICEAFTNSLHPHSFESFSAGVEDNRLVDPFAIRVMKEDFGIDMSQAKSKLVSTFEKTPINLVITVCDTDACPTFAPLSDKNSVKTIRLHHSFSDPPALTNGISNEDEKLNIYRKVAVEIKEFITKLPETYQELL
jgi:arsenate reductase